MDSLPPSSSSRSSQSSLQGKRSDDPETNPENTHAKKSKGNSGVAITHRSSSVSEAEPVLGESAGLKSFLMERLKPGLLEMFHEGRDFSASEILDKLGFSELSEHRVDWLLALVELIKQHGQCSDPEYFCQSPLAEALAGDVLEPGCHLDSLIEKLRNSGMPPPGRGRQRQWDARAILDKAPQIAQKLYSRPETEERLLLKQISENNYRNLTRLKLLGMCSDRWAIHYIKARLEQDVPLNDVRYEANKNQLMLPRINSSNPTSFFRGLLFYLDPQSGAYQKLLVQVEPRWLKTIENRSAYPEVLQTFIKARLEACPPGQVLDELNSVYPPLTIPGNCSSWAKYLVDTQSSEARTALQRCVRKKQTGNQWKKWARVELQEKLLTMLLDLDNGSDEAKLREYAMCLYRCTGHLALVATSLNQDQLTTGNDQPWTVDSVMHLLKITPAEHPLVQGNDGSYTVDNELLNEDSSAILSHRSVIMALKSIDKANYVCRGPSTIEGVPFGVLCERPLAAGTVIGEYKGAVTKRMELSSELRLKYANLTSTPLKKISDRLALVWCDHPEPAFHTESDLYTAWCPGVVMSESVMGNRKPVEGVRVTLGINGDKDGDFLKELNHSEHPNCVLMVAVDPEAIEWIDLDESYHLKPGVDLQNAFKLVVVTTESIDPKDSPVELTFDYTGCGETPLFKHVGADVAKKPGVLLSLPQEPWGEVKLQIPEVDVDVESLSADTLAQESGDSAQETENAVVRRPSGLKDLSVPAENMETEPDHLTASLQLKKHCRWNEEVSLSLQEKKRLAMMENIDFMTGRRPPSELPEKFLPTADNLPPEIKQYWEKSYPELRVCYKKATTTIDKERIILAYGLKAFPSYQPNRLFELIKAKFATRGQALPSASHIKDVAFYKLMVRHLLPSMKYNQLLDWTPFAYINAHAASDPELMEQFLLYRRARGIPLSKTAGSFNRTYKKDWQWQDLERLAPSLARASAQLTDHKIRTLELSDNSDDALLLVEWAYMGNREALKAYIRTWLYKGKDLARVCLKLRYFKVPLSGDASQYEWKVGDIETLMTPEDIDCNHEDTPWEEKPDSVLMLHVAKGSLEATKGILCQAIKQKKLTPTHLRNKKIPCPCGCKWTAMTIAASLKYLFDNEEIVALDKTSNQALYGTAIERKKQGTCPERMMLLIRAYLGDDGAFYFYLKSSLQKGFSPLAQDLNDIAFPPPESKEKWGVADVKKCLGLLTDQPEEFN